MRSPLHDMGVGEPADTPAQTKSLTVDGIAPLDNKSWDHQQPGWAYKFYSREFHNINNRLDVKNPVQKGVHPGGSDVPARQASRERPSIRGS